MRMTRISSSCAFLVLSLSVLSCGSPGPQEQGLPPSAKMSVTVTTGLVSLNVRHAPVSEVLAELCRQARLTVSVPDETQSDRLTLAFESLPLEDALKRVLVGQPHAFLYTQTGGREVIAGVRLLAKQQPTPTTEMAGARGLAPSQASQSLPTPSTRGAWGRGSTNSSEAQPVTISDDLSLDELKRSLTEAQNPTLRAATLEAIANRGEDEPVTPILATALSDTDQGVRDTALNLLKSSFDPVPIGPLASMATGDTNAESRMDAMTLMTEQLFTDERTEDDWATVTATLNRGLSDPDPDVRDQAALLLPDLAQAAQPTSKWGLHR